MPRVVTEPMADLVVEHCESCGVTGLMMNIDREGTRRWHDVQYVGDRRAWTPHTPERCRSLRRERSA